MDIELAPERVLLLPERISMDQSEGRAWTKRIEAFGTFAKLSGFLSKPADAEFEIVYRERRLQPFWYIACTARYAYQRARNYHVAVDKNVESVTIEGLAHTVAKGQITVGGTEHCREEASRQAWFEAVTGVADPALAAYLKDAGPVLADAAMLAQETGRGAVVVPPQAKTSMLVRDVLASAITRIEADTVTEERMEVHRIDLYYHPVHAFRYRWQGKEAVVEVDGITGVARTGGSTFEQFAGKVIDAEFLLNAGVEAAGIFIPGARLVEIVISKGLAAKKAKSAA